MHSDRRQFLASAAIATTTIAMRSAAAEAEKPALVDTHVHCFAGKDDPRFPYHPRGPYQPPDKASPEDLLRCMDEAGVSHYLPGPLITCCRVNGLDSATVLADEDLACSLIGEWYVAHIAAGGDPDLVMVEILAVVADNLPPGEGSEH